MSQTMATNENENKTESSKKFMFIKISNHAFALPLSSVREVLGLTQISTIPNMPNYFAGLLNLRGKIVSAVYLKKSLTFINPQEKEVNSKRPCVIITEVQGRMFGAIADDVTEVSAILESEVDHSVDGLENKEVYSGIIKRSGESLAPILNLEKALKVNELLKINVTKSA